MKSFSCKSRYGSSSVRVVVLVREDADSFSISFHLENLQESMQRTVSYCS